MDSSCLPEEVQRHLERAYVYEESGDLENGLRECELVIQLAPELPEAHNLRGIILDELGQKEEAIAAYREAVRLAPTFREARENLLRLLALTWLFLGIPLPFVLKRWRCQHCGYTWRETRDRE